MKRLLFGALAVAAAQFAVRWAAPVAVDVANVLDREMTRSMGIAQFGICPTCGGHGHQRPPETVG